MVSGGSRLRALRQFAGPHSPWDAGFGGLGQVADPSYNRFVRISLIGRNVICLASMPPEAFDFRRLEEVLAIGRPQTELSNPQVALADFERFRVLVAEGRVQIDVPPTATAALTQRGLEEVVRQAVNYRLTAVGFNGLLRIDLEQDEPDPSTRFLDLSGAADQLGADSVRGGWKLVYRIDDARISLALEPDLNDERGWLGQINRHYEGQLQPDQLSQAIAWFEDLHSDPPSVIRPLLSTTEVREHA